MAAGDVVVVNTNSRSFNANVFDGVDDYVEIPHNAAQLGANLSNGFTISAWVNARSKGEGSGTTDGKILNKTKLSYSMRGNNNNVFLSVNGETTKSLSADNSMLPFGVWKNILVTCSYSGTATHYLNGTISGVATTAGAGGVINLDSIDVMRIGNISTTTNNTFDGSIRSVKMWNRVLSTTEITEEYNGTNHPAGLIHNFKLGGDYQDYGSVGVNATNSGSVPYNVEDNVAVAVKAQRVTAKATGKYLLYSGNSGQVGSVAIEGA